MTEDQRSPRTTATAQGAPAAGPSAETSAPAPEPAPVELVTLTALGDPAAGVCVDGVCAPTEQD